MTVTLETQGITITIKRILELLELEEDDDYGILKPTDHAFRSLLNLVSQGYIIPIRNLTRNIDFM